MSIKLYKKVHLFGGGFAEAGGVTEVPGVRLPYALDVAGSISRRGAGGDPFVVKEVALRTGYRIEMIMLALGAQWPKIRL